MDIQILLALQEFRESVGGFLTSFLNKMTFLGDMNTVLVLMAVVYWCVSRNFGTYLLMGWSGNRLLNGVLKVTACVYRPWIRDARIIPEPDAMKAATGYSFPSGHSMNGATLFGGVAVRKDMPLAARITLGIAFVLVAFSRCFLGVHTPQDVLVGGIGGLLMMWLAYKLLCWIEAHPEKDLVVAGTGIALAVIVAVYAGLKSYPEDFDAAGNLLVDGAKMANDTFKGAGWCIAFFVGWVLERRFVHFTTDNLSMKERVTRLSVGLLSYYAVALILVPLIKTWIPNAAGTLISCFLQMLYVVFLFPWIMQLFEKKKNG